MLRLAFTTSLFTMALFPLDTARSSGAFSNPPHCAGVKTSARRSNAQSPLLLGGLRVQPCSPYYLAQDKVGALSFESWVKSRHPTTNARAALHVCTVESRPRFWRTSRFPLEAWRIESAEVSPRARAGELFLKDASSMVPTATFCAQSRCLRPPSFFRRLPNLASL